MENRFNKWYKDIKEKMVKLSKEVEGWRYRSCN